MSPIRKQNEVIEVLSEGEQNEIFEKKKKQKIGHYKLQIALLASQFDLLIQVAKYYLQSQQSEKDEIIQQQMLNYFKQNANIDLQFGHFQQRIQPKSPLDPKQILSNCLILYGVDFLKTKTIRKMFQQQNPEVFWMNQSHCKLVFADNKQVRDAVATNRRNKEQIQKEMIDSDFFEGWIQLNPYYELNFERRLYVRYATLNQTNIQKLKQTLFSQYQMSKQQFQRDLLKDEQIRAKYYELLPQKPKNYCRIIQKNQYPERERRRRSRDRNHNNRWEDNQNNENRKRYNNGYYNNNGRRYNNNNDYYNNNQFTRKRALQNIVEKKKVDNIFDENLNQNLSLIYRNDNSKNDILGLSVIMQDETDKNNLLEDSSLSLDFNNDRQNYQQQLVKEIQNIQISKLSIVLKEETQDKKSQGIKKKKYNGFQNSGFAKSNQTKKQSGKKNNPIQINDD